MTDLLSSCRNYDNYRQAYGRCAGFKIPILGVHLKDLISVNEAMSDYVEDDKVNVQKLQALYSHIHELIQLQQTPPRLDANKDLVHLLTVGRGRVIRVPCSWARRFLAACSSMRARCLHSYSPISGVAVIALDERD